MKNNAFILYDGPSLIDGGPIVAIGLYRKAGANDKTGAMVQTYILRSDMAPQAAINAGLDYSICGGCGLRGDGTGKERSCYVVIFQGPRAVFDGYSRGIYPVATADDARQLGAGRMVRLGTYGDPYAVPLTVWQTLLSGAAGWTGYSHQWERPDSKPLQAYVMASADSLEKATMAHAAGWRTYRIADAPEPGEIVCPSSSGVQCLDCGLCDGTRLETRQNVKSITIPAHGPGKKWVEGVQNAN